MTPAKRAAKDNSKANYGYDENTKKYGEECFEAGINFAIEHARGKSFYDSEWDDVVMHFSDLEDLNKETEE